MIKNRKFTELATGKVFEVIDQFEDIAILDNRAKVKVNKLLDKSVYDEYIDPKNFFRNESLLNTFTEKIRQLPNESIKVDRGFDEESEYRPKNNNYFDDGFKPTIEDSAVLPYDPEEEKRELMKKAQSMFSNYSQESNKQLESFKTLLEDEIAPIQSIQETNRLNLKQEIMNSERPQQQDNAEYYNTQNQSDPIIQMFRNVKRNTDFNVEFTVNNKIPRLDFIEMMEDSYNTSIIDFLAEEFTNNLLLNPQALKSKIKDQIIKMVYKNSNKENSNIPQSLETKPAVKKRVTKKEISNND